MNLAESQMAFEEWAEGETPKEIWRVCVVMAYKGNVVHLVRYTPIYEGVELYVNSRRQIGDVKSVTIQKFAETERHLR